LSYALEAFDAKESCGCAEIRKGWGSIVEWWERAMMATTAKESAG